MGGKVIKEVTFLICCLDRSRILEHLWSVPNAALGSCGCCYQLTTTAQEVKYDSIAINDPVGLNYSHILFSRLKLVFPVLSGYDKARRISTVHFHNRDQSYFI